MPTREIVKITAHEMAKSLSGAAHASNPRIWCFSTLKGCFPTLKGEASLTRFELLFYDVESRNRCKADLQGRSMVVQPEMVRPLDSESLSATETYSIRCRTKLHAAGRLTRARR